MSSLSLRRSSRLVSSAVNTTTKGAQASYTRADLDGTLRPRKRARVDNRATSSIAYADPEDVADSLSPLTSSGEELSPVLRKKSRQRKTAEPLEPKPEEFSPRATSLWKIGPHVSSAGGVENTIVNAASVGATAFALFLKSQRQWAAPDLKPESVAAFKERMKSFGYSPAHILPHGNYLVNLGNPDDEKRKKSYQCFIDDLKRCELLGLHLYNFHPGSTVGQTTPEASLALIADCINRAHQETENVVIVLENMAGAGNILGARFSELGSVIRLVKEKSRVGVCLDTCHLFVAGYDIRTKEGWDATLAEFEREIGLEYLRGMHLNDSKAPLGSKKDRHANIGLGELKLSTFAHILSDPRTQDLPLILETPAFDAPGTNWRTGGMDVWRSEVAVLHRLAGGSSATQGRGETAGLDTGTEDYLATWTRELADRVGAASKMRSAKGSKLDDKGKSVKKRRKGEVTKEVGEDESEEHRCSDDEAKI